MAIFTGAGVAIVTPFNEDGSINYDRLDELIELALKRNREDENITYSFESNILSGVSMKNLKGGAKLNK